MAAVKATGQDTANPGDKGASEQWEYLAVAGPSTTNLTPTGNPRMRKEPNVPFGREAFVLEQHLDKLGERVGVGRRSRPADRSGILFQAEEIGSWLDIRPLVVTGKRTSSLFSNGRVVSLFLGFLPRGLSIFAFAVRLTIEANKGFFEVRVGREPSFNLRLNNMLQT